MSSTRAVLPATLVVLVLLATPVAAATPTVEAFVAQIGARMSAGDVAGALALSDEAMAAHRDEPALLLVTARIESTRADALRARGDGEGSARAYRRALNLVGRAWELDPDAVPPWAHLVAGYAEIQGGDLAAAEPHLERALAAEPDNAEALRLRAQCRDSRGDGKGAEADLARAVRVGGGRLTYVAAHARLLADHGRVQDAITALWTTYAGLGPGAPEDRWRLLGQIHHHALDVLDFAQSLKALDEALRIDPDNLSARLERGILLYRLERHDDADRELATVLAAVTGLTPGERAEAHFRRGLIAKHGGDFAAARTELEAAVGDDPAHAAAWQSLAAVRLRLDDRAGARAAMQRFRTLQAGPPGAGR